MCRTLNAEQPETKILMLTAARTTDQLVEGPRARRRRLPGQAVPLRGARRARARARAAAPAPARPPVLRRGDLELDPAKRTATRGGADLALSRKEFGVLEVLMAADGAVVSLEELLDRVWDDNVDPFTNTVRMTIMKLRRKLGEPAVIHTVAGSGYRVVMRRASRSACGSRSSTSGCWSPARRCCWC